MYLDKVEVKTRNKAKSYEQISGVLMSITPVLGFILFGLIPMILAIVMAFCHMEGVTLVGASWVGIENFKTVTQGVDFWKSVGNTFFYALSLPVCLVISLVVSFLLTKNVKGKKLFRTIFSNQFRLFIHKKICLHFSYSLYSSTWNLYSPIIR